MSQDRYPDLTFAVVMVGVEEVSRVMIHFLNDSFLELLPGVAPSLLSMVTSRAIGEGGRKDIMLCFPPAPGPKWMKVVGNVLWKQGLV